MIETIAVAINLFRLQTYGNDDRRVAENTEERFFPESLGGGFGERAPAAY